MISLSEPIVIAAIAAGGSAILVLIIAGSMYLYRRCHPHSSSNPRTPSSHPDSRHHPKSASYSSSRDRAQPHSASSNPYHTPIVPLVQPPPAPYRRTPASHPSPSLGTEYAQLSSPETLLRTPPTGAKLRKFDTPSPRPRPRQREPDPPPTESQQPMISPSLPSAGRMSTASSVMLITYEQGLAKLGLDVPRPPASASASSSAAATPHSASTGTSTGSMGKSPYSGYRSGSTASPRMVSPQRSSPGGGSERRERERESFPMTVTPNASHFGGEEYGWQKDSEWEAGKAGRNEAWMPSYYQPAAAGERKAGSDANSRWGGKI